MKKEKSCGAVVIQNIGGETKVLLIRHVKGHWSFPKGHTEAGETEEETAKREIREETGLDVTLDTGFRQSIVYSPEEGVEKEVVYFLAQAARTETTPQPEEIQACGWYDFDTARDTVTYDNDRSVLAGAARYLAQARAGK